MNGYNAEFNMNNAVMNMKRALSINRLPLCV